VNQCESTYDIFLEAESCVLYSERSKFELLTNSNIYRNEMMSLYFLSIHEEDREHNSALLMVIKDGKAKPIAVFDNYSPTDFKIHLPDCEYIENNELIAPDNFDALGDDTKGHYSKHYWRTPLLTAREELVRKIENNDDGVSPNSLIQFDNSKKYELCILNAKILDSFKKASFNEIMINGDVLAAGGVVQSKDGSGKNMILPSADGSIPEYVYISVFFTEGDDMQGDSEEENAPEKLTRLTV